MRAESLDKAEQELAEFQLAAENYPTDMSIKFRVAERLFLLEQYQDAIPIFDTALADFNYAQLFTENRFVGGDRFGDAEQATTEHAESAVASALQAARRLDPIELEAVLERAAVTLGVPIFIDEVVAPALMRIGHGWAQGSVWAKRSRMSSTG